MILLMTLISTFCSSAELLQDVMDKTKAVAQKPEIYIKSPSSISSGATDSSLRNAIMANDYTNAISNWLLNNGVSSNDVALAKSGHLTSTEETNTFWETRFQTISQEAETADTFLRSIPSSTILPIIFQILEEGAFGTNEFVKKYTNWYEGDEEPIVGFYFGKPIKEKNISVYRFLYKYIENAFKLDTDTDWHIMANCYRGDWDFESREPCSDYVYYWWYDGRKYATNIWNDFYRCWQYEQARENPRPSVLRELAYEISGLGISALPIVSSSIQNGDNSLAPVLKALAERLHEGGITNQPYLAWYQQNSVKYVLPTCEGLEAAKIRITDTNFVNEIEGIKRPNIPGYMSARLDNSWPGFMKVYADQINCFYTNHPSVPDYWYYKLPDDVLEVDDNVVLSIDRNVTNYNPRFLTPSAE